MAPVRYRVEDLHALRDSPLVTKPDHLPNIHQWIDNPNDQKKQRKNDDTEDAKRSNLTQARNKHSQSGEIFLGPKIGTFASTSAAKQSKEERSVSDELKAKVERIGRERMFRDREGDRSGARRDNMNGHAEGAQNKLRNRRDSGNDGERPRLNGRNRQGDEDDDNVSSPKRPSFSDKLNKPWFRDAIEQKAGKNANPKDLRHGPENSWGKENRHGPKPSWMANEHKVDYEPEVQTQQDFAAWKEAYKKGHGDKVSVSKKSGKEGTCPDTENGSVSHPDMPAAEPPLFGLWGQAESEYKKPEGYKKNGKPAKVSRFFGAGAVNPVPDQSPSDPPLLPSSPASAAVEDDENRKGFQNIMQMLRAGGTTNSPQLDLKDSRPTMQLPHHLRKSTPPMHTHQQTSERTRRSPKDGHDTQSPQAQVPGNATPPNHQHPRRDADFLNNLMKQDPRPPFQEGQIYGQNYHQRRDTDDITKFLSGTATEQPTKPPGLPPGMNDNQHAFAKNLENDTSIRSPAAERSFNEYLSSRSVPGPGLQMQLPDFRFPPPPPPPPPGDFGPTLAAHQRPTSHEGIAPPPGFNAVRSNVPPGLPSYGPGQNGPAQMRAPPQMHFMGPPPPGFGPQPPIYLQTSGRRMQNQSIPPGFEVPSFGQGSLGVPPMMPISPPHVTPPHMKPAGGPTGYQGI